MGNRVVSYVKSKVLKPGLAPRTIKAGILSGITMELNPACQSQILFGLYEREIFSAFSRYSTNLATAIDVGANDGLYTLFFLKKTPVQKVFAFEPLAEYREQLNRNLALNGLTGDPRLEIIPNFVNSFSNENSSTLDSLIPRIKTPCLIKMDIDTAEVNALKGARALMQIPGVHWIIETHSLELKKECQAMLSDAKCGVKIVPNAWWRLFVPEQRPIDHNRWMVAGRN